MELEAAAWKELTRAWRGLPQEALLLPGAAGPEWSVKDVMNHLAAWMEATGEVMPRLLAGQKLPKGQYNIASFNAKHAAIDAGRSLAASRRRLSRARRAVLGLAREVPEAALINARGKPGLWLKYATYGHYAEHLPTLLEFRKQVSHG